MKISLEWISDFVDLSGIDVAKIANELTLRTAEVEGVETVHRNLRGVLVGKILTAEPFAADKDGEPKTYHRCTVVCGQNGDGTPRTYQTVCGAPNARVGLIAPFAPAGVVLAGDKKIEKSTVAGYPSDGMLCSAAEIGLGYWHEMLFEMPESTIVGTPLETLIPEEDTLIEVDNKSVTHRPDLWGHYGFAREFAALLNRPLRPYPVEDLDQFNHLPAFPLTVDAPEDCPCYGCLAFEMPRTVVPSPIKMQYRLHTLGQRTFNLLVDMTNYVSLELGQPSHAFDGDYVKAIRVTPMGKNGSFTTLDGQERKMLPDDLLIWNQNEPVAIAGIMGGLHSEVTVNTDKLLLEVANFKASRIRRTGGRLDLRTDASQRFEKSQPPVNVKVGTARLLRLVVEAGAQPTVTSRFTYVGDLKEDYRPLSMSRDLLHRLAGQAIPDDTVLDILHSLGFLAEFDATGILQVGIPSHRSQKDISIPEDIVEEVLRMYGYANIPPVMPKVPLEPLYTEKALRFEHRIRRLLTQGHRFIEVQTYGWMDDAFLAKIGYEPKATLELANPSNQNFRRMRTSLIPNLLPLVKQNKVHREAFRLFEIGHVYYPRETEFRGEGPLQLSQERRVEVGCFSGISYQQGNQPSLEEHFRQIRGAIEDIGSFVNNGVRAKSEVGGAEQSTAPWENPGEFIIFTRNGEEVARAGILPGKMLETVIGEGSGQVVWFEMRAKLDSYLEYPEFKYQPLPVYPQSWQDYSICWSMSDGFTALSDKLAAFTHPLLRKSEFVTVYKGKGLELGTASYTFRYWIGTDHTMSEAEIDGFRTDYLAFLKREGLTLRG